MKTKVFLLLLLFWQVPAQAEDPVQLVFDFIASMRRQSREVQLSEPLSDKTHLVILVHGIGGTEKTFGSLRPALEKHLKVLDPFSEYRFETFIYDTFSKDKGVPDFSKDLGQRISELLGSHPPDGLKLSIVSHSQGGLVSLHWIFQAASEKPEFFPQYFKYLDAFITLGTPFWGSKVAVSAGSLLGKLNFLGDKQIEDMSLASDMIYDFRLGIINSEKLKVSQKIAEKLRPLNIGAMSQKLGKIPGFSSGSLGKDQFEDDGAVLLPSARFDFIYARDIVEDYFQNDELEAADFDSTAVSPFHVVEATHIAVLGFTGVADIDEECIDDIQCDHPTFEMILNHLSRTPIDLDNSLIKTLTGFVVDLNIQLPVGHQLRKKDIKIELPQRQGKWDAIRSEFSRDPGNDLRLAGRRELFSTTARFSKDKKIFRYSFTGAIRNPVEGTGMQEQELVPNRIQFKQVPVEIVVKAKGYKTRKIFAPVKGSYTTFVEINLEPVN